MYSKYPHTQAVHYGLGMRLDRLKGKDPIVPVMLEDARLINFFIFLKKFFSTFGHVLAEHS